MSQVHNNQVAILQTAFNIHTYLYYQVLT